jgi:thioredoxin 2
MPIVACPSCGAKNRVHDRGPGFRAVCGRCGLSLPTAGAVDGKPLEVTDLTFARALEEAGSRPLLVDCWAEWCGPCRMLAPTLDALAAEAGGRYVVAKLNIDQNPHTAAKFHVQSIPTLLIFEGGRLVETLVGVQPKVQIQARLLAHAVPGD